MIRLRPPHSTSDSSSHHSTSSSHHNGNITAIAVVVGVGVVAPTVEEHGNHSNIHNPIATTKVTPRYKQRPKQPPLLSHRTIMHHLLRRLPVLQVPSRIIHSLYCGPPIIILCGSMFVLLICFLTRNFDYNYNNNNNHNRSDGSLTIPSFLLPNLRFSHSATTSTSTNSIVTLDMKEYLQQPNNRLRTIDYQYFTIRINTWERIEQLQLSIQHHLSCSSVLQIQIVWCIDQTISIPDWLIQLEQTIEPIVLVDTNMSFPRIVIERHSINSLNERFHPLVEVPTAAVLSIDDDVLRPCIALDATFYIWLRNPDRQVGFDARSHEVVHSTRNMTHPHHPYHIDHHHHHHHHHDPSPTSESQQLEPQWKYSYMSVTEKTNLYSLTLTRYSFFHQYYMTLYMNHMPSIIRTTIDENFNCEDIAMSMYISACHSQHKVPLLANVWAVKSQIKMYVAKKISGTNNHKQIRDDCVHHFSQLLHLQDRNQFHTVPLHLGTLFEYGDAPENWNDPYVPNRSELSSTMQDAVTTIERWKQSDDDQQHLWMKELKQYREDVIRPIYDAGYVEKTIPWQHKFSLHQK